MLPAALQAALAAQGVYAGAARYFTNAVDTRTHGLEIVSTWQQDWRGWGHSDFTLAYNHNSTSITRVAANPALLAAEHTLGDWSLRLAATRYGRFTVPQNNAALDQVFGAAWVADTSVGWKSGAWSATVGIDNLTDRYPDQVTSAGNLNTNGIFRYSSFSPFGFNGRQYYARAGYSW